MKTKDCKLRRIFGIVLCCAVLTGLLTALVFAGSVSAADDGKAAYTKITSTDELEVGRKYVITYTDSDGKVYALSTDTDPDNAKIAFPVELTVAENGTLPVDSDGNYVFTVAAKDSSGSVRLQANNGQWLRMNGDGIFHNSSNPYITLTYDANKDRWSVNNTSARALRLDGENFGLTSGGTSNPDADFEIWAAPPATTDYIKITSLAQLADLDADTDFVVVLETKDGLRAMGYGNSGNFLYDVDAFVGEDDADYISVRDSYPVVLNLHNKAKSTFGTYNSVKYWGFDEYGMKLAAYPSYYFYPQNAGSSNSGPFRNREYSPTGSYNYNNTVRFEYGTDKNSDKIYIRGNGNNTYLGYNDEGNLVGSLSQSSENRVPVQIYVAVPEESERINVEFYDGDGNVSMVAYVKENGKLSLPSSMDFTVDKLIGDDTKVEGVKEFTYTLIGWTMTKPGSSYLTLKDSCNIFDYDEDYTPKKDLDPDAKDDGQGHVDWDLIKKYGIIGDGNPELSPEESKAFVDLAKEKITAGETLKLYPVYAVRGFDSVVTADDSGTRVVGVTDWKSDPKQGLNNYYSNAEREKWLGYITVQIYKDGEPWTDTTMYYRYHNDDTTDLSIKYIDDLMVNAFVET